MGDYVVGVDMGGTNVVAAIVNAQNEVLSRKKIATDAEDGADVTIGRIADAVRDAAGKAEIQLEQVAAVGIGAPGPLDPDTGLVVFAPNLKWDNVPLGQMLGENLGVPVFVENDVNVGTLGEYELGAGRGARYVVGIFVGTGIGGGVILDGKLYHGPSKVAGEVGHIIIKVKGARCGCGNRGCLEALASRTAIQRELLKRIKRGESKLLSQLTNGGKDRIRSKVLSKAIKAEDKVALKVMNRAAKYLGIGVASIVNFLNPEVIVLGGGVMEAMEDFYMPRVMKVVEKYAMPRSMDGVSIVPAQLGDDAGILGAAVLARQRLAASS